MSTQSEFTPRSILSFRRGYALEDFRADLIAGITVGVVALPLAMALAIASGLPPERGLVTAVVAGFLISALGGSRVQIGGPTGAFVIIVSGVVQRHGYEGLAVATLLAGGMLLLLAAARLGTMIKYIPYPVTTGFTTGIAVIIFSTQVRDFFGLQIPHLPPEFLPEWASYFQSLHTLNLAATGVGLGSLLLLIFFRRLDPRIPGALLTIIGAAAVVHVFELPVATIGTRFGEIPAGFPLPQFPNIDVNMVRDLLPDAFTIALLAGIESLLSAVVADGMTGDRHSSNGELMAQGFANIGSVLFGGIPATGAIARTATNIKTGARTPVAGMIHAGVLLSFMLLLAPLARLIPLPSLAAILFLVAWNMSELDHFRYLLRAPRGDVLVLLTTFFLTILADLTLAVEVGVVLASLLFMRRMSEAAAVVSKTQIIQREEGGGIEEPRASGPTELSSGIEVFEVQGPFFFGVADKFKDTISRVEAPPHVFILRLASVPVIDATAMHCLREFHHKCQRQGARLILSEVQPVVREALEKFGLLASIGTAHVHATFDAARMDAEQAQSRADGA